MSAKTMPSFCSYQMVRAIDIRVSTQFLIALALSGYWVVMRRTFVYYTIKWDSRETASYGRRRLACAEMVRTNKYCWPENICAAALTKARIEVEGRRRFLSRGWRSKKGWLCWCDITNNFFCWLCLLLRTGVSKSWAEKGYSYMRNLLSKGKDIRNWHHTWRLWNVENKTVDVLFSRARREEIEPHN